MKVGRMQCLRYVGLMWSLFLPCRDLIGHVWASRCHTKGFEVLILLFYISTMTLFKMITFIFYLEHTYMHNKLLRANEIV